MNSGTGGCRPAASVLNMSSTDCNKCPFPFCVVAEASIIKSELREQVARIMRRLGNSMEETAEAMKVSLRSAYRYVSVYEDVNCAQCSLIRSQDVMCKSNAYSVVCRGEQYVIILNKHKHATIQELKAVEYFIGYVFPSSIVRKSTNSHDYWVLSRVELEEVEKFKTMCGALDKYTLSLSRGAECLQRTR